MVSSVMKKGFVQAVLVGCDRLAANGDACNKIGTSGVAILAKHYGVPFYVFVPTSTIDLSIPDGDNIVIEERAPEEVSELWYRERMIPSGARVYNPAFDVTPANLITAIVTEAGIVWPPYPEKLKELFQKQCAGKPAHFFYLPLAGALRPVMLAVRITENKMAANSQSSGTIVGMSLKNIL
jgi:methylthioribose-1-phosphate isomerase